MAKYNQLLRIEEELGEAAVYPAALRLPPEVIRVACALTLFLLVLLLLLQWSLWLGKGSWLRVWQLDSQLNHLAPAMKSWLTAIWRWRRKSATSSRAPRPSRSAARSELGMIKRGEVFFQLLEPRPPPPGCQSFRTVKTP